jgi:nucleotide-binding universal stress UspA family protein
MDALVNSLEVDRASIQVHQSWGTPWQEIRRAAKFLAADLVVIGTVGRSGIQGLLLGNTAEKILDTCDCSILTVKPEGFQSPLTQ